MRTNYFTKREKDIIEVAREKYPESEVDIPKLKIGIISILEGLVNNSLNGKKTTFRTMTDYYKHGEE